MIYYYSESLPTNNIEDKDYYSSNSIHPLSVEPKISYSLYKYICRRKKKGYTTCLGLVRVVLGHEQEGWRNKKRKRDLFPIPLPVHCLSFLIREFIFFYLQFIPQAF